MWVPQMTFCHSYIHQILVLISILEVSGNSKDLPKLCLFATSAKEKYYKKPSQCCGEVKLSVTYKQSVRDQYCITSSVMTWIMGRIL